MSHVGRIGASLLTTYFLCSSASLFLVFAHYVSRFVGATSSVNPEDGVWVKLATLGIAGALGGQIHSLHAFVSAAERKSLEWSSVPRILLSPVAAAGLAIVLFLTLDRWIAESSFNHPPATEQLVAAAGLAGLFTESVFKFLGVLAQGFDRLSGILVSKLLEIVHSELGSSNGNGTIKPACPSAKGSSPTRPDAVPLKVPREALSGASFRRDIAGHVPRGGDRASAVIAACAQAFPESAENATEFARGVCGLLDVTDFDLLPAGASVDAWLRWLQESPPWRELGRGDDAAAKEKADAGLLVFGILPARELLSSDGHLVVVVSGPLDPAHDRFPTACWGASPSASHGWRESLLHAFRIPKPGCHLPATSVRYFARALPDRAPVEAADQSFA